MATSGSWHGHGLAKRSSFFHSIPSRECFHSSLRNIALHTRASVGLTLASSGNPNFFQRASCLLASSFPAFSMSARLPLAYRTGIGNMPHLRHCSGTKNCLCLRELHSDRPILVKHSSLLSLSSASPIRTATEPLVSLLLVLNLTIFKACLSVAISIRHLAFFTLDPIPTKLRQGPITSGSN